MTDEFEQRCPFLGLADDEDTSISYPSEWNVCHKCHGNPSPNLEYQGATCLSIEHIKCEVFVSSGTAWMPAELKNQEGSSIPADPTQKRKLIFSILLIAIITFLITVWFNFSTDLSNIFEAISRPTSTITLVPTFTNTPVLETPTPIVIASTMTPYPTMTKFVYTKCGNALDEEFGADPNYVIHQIKDGESIDKVLASYHVTYEQVLAVNYFVPKPLWVGFPVIIPLTRHDPSGTKTYQALELNETNTSIDVLSAKLGIEPDVFMKLNDLEDDCNSFSGWFIVPRDKVKYYE